MVHRRKLILEDAEGGELTRSSFGFKTFEQFDGVQAFRRAPHESIHHSGEGLAEHAIDKSTERLEARNFVSANIHDVSAQLARRQALCLPFG